MRCVVKILMTSRANGSHMVSARLQAARKTRKPAKQPGLRVRHDGASENIDIEVVPVVRRGHPYYLVLFQKPEPSADGKSRKAAAEKKFNLIPSDVGRPFTQISTTLHCPELPSLITETIDTVSPVERTVQDDGERPTSCGSARTKLPTTASTERSSRCSTSTP